MFSFLNIKKHHHLWKLTSNQCFNVIAWQSLSISAKNSCEKKKQWAVKAKDIIITQNLFPFVLFTCMSQHDTGKQPKYSVVVFAECEAWKNPSG